MRKSFSSCSFLTIREYSIQQNFPTNNNQLLVKMKEDTEKERLEQLEQEELEKQKRLSRRSSSPAMRHSEREVAERSAHSEPIARHTPFVSFPI